MSVIENNENIKSQNGDTNKETYVLPAVVREYKEDCTFEKALTIAFILHIVVFALMLIIPFVLKLLGIQLDLFKRPETKPKDIEFVLVDKEGTPIDKKTKNRADKNSRAGGKHDPKRPVSLPQSPAPKGPAKKPTPPKPAKKAEAPKKQATPKQPTVQKPAVQTPKQSLPKLEVPTPKPSAPAPRPTPSPVMPKPTVKPQSNFNIPIPKTSIPPMAQPSKAPVTAAPTIGGGSGSAKGGSSSPAPSFSPTTSGKGGSSGGRGTGAGGGGRFSNGTGSSYGNLGNPGPGNPNGAPGIDAIKEPDFGPYMKELQRRIKMNWDPPKGNESKRVVLLFSIARDGRLLNISVHRSSGLPAADKAAIDAVKLTAPFRPLPPEYKRNSVDIQFTFDYNVFGISG